MLPITGNRVRVSPHRGIKVPEERGSDELLNIDSSYHIALETNRNSLGIHSQRHKPSFPG